MFGDSTFGLVIFVSLYVISRIISESSLRDLSPEQRTALLVSFSGYRLFSLIAIFVIVIAYVLSIYFLSDYDRVVTPFFFGVVLLILIGNSIFALYKLRGLDLPKNYLRAFWLSAILQYAGVIFLFVPTLSKYLFNNG